MTAGEVLAARGIEPNPDWMNVELSTTNGLALDVATGWLLIERGADGVSEWVSLHDTMSDAARYYDTNEGGDWWQVVVLVHLDTGIEYQVDDRVTTFSPVSS